ncbi:MAG: Phosphoheptose isomerase-like protein [Solirubrobacterales bacterium]|nr:Phosphoheptose isomerase-like protein [Solirubrobacterales bacterium]
MTPTATHGALAAHLDELLARRTEANGQFFVQEAERLARLCHRMAERFARGGRLLALGASPAARSDARHVAVEFVHPVIVGKRALPALGLTAEGGELARQLELIAREDDIAIAFPAEGDDALQTARAVALARERGCLTIAFSELGAEWEFEAPSEDGYVRQELIETLYHVLWELVHVFFDHRGLLEGRSARRVHDAGASSFLYPFLAEHERELEPVIEDVRRSVLMKAEEIGALRTQTLTDNRDELLDAAGALRASFEQGGKLLALGNGGSATDAMDVVADFRATSAAGGARPAIDLTEDSAILTAIANDIGIDAIFSRQVIAYGLPGDALLALSTSGNSRNVIDTLGQARRQGLLTIALVGYDGGRVGSERLADHVVITRSEHIPRIQEAQASAYHALRELVELAPRAEGAA